MDFENQQMIERMYDARQRTPLYKAYFRKFGIDNEATLAVMSAIATHKRANVITMLSILGMGHFKGDFNKASTFLEQCVQEGVLNFNGEKDEFTVRFPVDEKTENLARQYQYLPPMIVPPKKLTHNKSSGYLTRDADSLILRDNHHDGDICLDHLNKLNRIKLSANIEVVKKIRNSWKGLDKQKSDETFQKYQDRIKAFENYEKHSFDVIALMEAMGNEFYLTHKPDKRGRTYCQGYHVNYQGNAWNKAIVEFANKEMLDD